MPTKAAPAFGGKLCTPEYYASIISIINVLRPLSSLATIAKHLGAQGFTMPSGKAFTRGGVSNFISNNIKNKGI
jgi:hypothetical protein